MGEVGAWSADDRSGGVSMEIREYAYWPDRSGPLGLLLCEDDQGARWTIGVERGWLQLAVIAGRIAADMTVPDSVTLPVRAEGWPDDLTSRDEWRLLDSVCRALADGDDWEQIRVEVLEAAWLAANG
jgi:hypothetical protein